MFNCDISFFFSLATNTDHLDVYFMVIPEHQTIDHFQISIAYLNGSLQPNDKGFFFRGNENY